MALTFNVDSVHCAHFFAGRRYVEMDRPEGAETVAGVAPPCSSSAALGGVAREAVMARGVLDFSRGVLLPIRHVRPRARG